MITEEQIGLALAIAKIRLASHRQARRDHHCDCNDCILCDALVELAARASGTLDE